MDHIYFVIRILHPTMVKYSNIIVVSLNTIITEGTAHSDLETEGTPCVLYDCASVALLGGKQLLQYVKEHIGYIHTAMYSTTLNDMEDSIYSTFALFRL